jgi:hypothetical protein
MTDNDQKAGCGKDNTGADGVKLDVAGLELPSGICDFETVWVVTTYTSGNELRGKPEHFGEYASAMDARQALADDGFTNGQWGWRMGYSDAEISKHIKHFNYRTATIPNADAIAALVGALQEYMEHDADYCRINQLGDHTQSHRYKRAFAALARLGGGE